MVVSYFCLFFAKPLLKPFQTFKFDQNVEKLLINRTVVTSDALELDFGEPGRKFFELSRAGTL